MQGLVWNILSRRALALVMACAGWSIIVAGCSTSNAPKYNLALTNNIPLALSNAVQSVKQQYAPDPHVVIFKVDAVQQGHHFALVGEVENPAAKTAAVAAALKAGFKVDDYIDVLPDARLGENRWGIATLSVVNVREKAGNAAEMGTQMLTGEAFEVWLRQSNWFLIKTPDHYVGWVEAGGFTNCDRAMVDAWQAAPHLIVTAYEERILAGPNPGAATVSDVVMGCQVKSLGEEGDWFKVGLADGRVGYLPKNSATDFGAWQASRSPTPENIEKTARLFLGRPYNWGCNSIRGLDCSGLTKFTFFLNGIRLDRQASEQCEQGVEVPLNDDYSHLKKGDLLFFGHHNRREGRERIDHTAIYLGDKLYIQASEFVRISSLDKNSPLADERRIRTLLHARRILPAQ